MGYSFTNESDDRNPSLPSQLEYLSSDLKSHSQRLRPLLRLDLLQSFTCTENSNILQYSSMTAGALTLPIYGTDFKTLPAPSMFPLVLWKQSQCLFSAFKISGRISVLINSQLKLQLYNIQVYTGYGGKYEVQLMSLMVKYDIENKIFLNGLKEMLISKIIRLICDFKSDIKSCQTALLSRQFRESQWEFSD